MTGILDGLASTFVDTFADSELASYVLADGSASASIKVIFEAETKVNEVGSDVPVIMTPTRFSAAEADLPAGYGQGDTLRFRNRDWTVRAPQPDGHGMVVLEVEGG